MASTPQIPPQAPSPPPPPPPHDAARANRKVGLIAAGAALAMLGLGYAAVPLYRMFCQATGFAGTTQRASAAQAATVRATGAPITVRFDDEKVSMDDILGALSGAGYSVPKYEKSDG